MDREPNPHTLETASSYDSPPSHHYDVASRPGTMWNPWRWLKLGVSENKDAQKNHHIPPILAVLNRENE